MASPKFWQSALLYLTRPNLTDKRFIGAELCNIWTFSQNIDILPFIQNGPTIEQIVERLQLQVFKIQDTNKKICLNSIVQSESSFFIIRKFFPKKTLKTLQQEANSSQPKSNDHEFDIAILSPCSNSLTIVPIIWTETIQLKSDESSIAFRLTLEGDSVESECLLTTSPSNYFVDKLQHKLERWMETSDAASVSANMDEPKGSIQAISVERYCATYNRLKSTYSLGLLQMWSKAEKTDPVKYIFEDIAIAAYLITLWQEEREKHKLDKHQTFLDVGCGNGLLVYILSKEGYDGCGIDIRARNIWKHYGESVKLIEMRIDLFDANVVHTLPSCDWMIGNHSDELTPWILYMAANKSSTTRAFILPCCCYDFDGFKYQRTKKANKSQYHNYIDFLEELAIDFGFNCFRDKLRIPSTKRVCLVCNERNYLPTASKKLKTNNNNNNTSTPGHNGDGQDDNEQSLEDTIKLKRKSIVDGRLQLRASLRLREKQESVRNCTRIDQNVKEAIIGRLSSRLIHDSNNNVKDGLTFGQAIQLLDDELRSNLKKQCGGLQTFVRNHKHIFTIALGRIQFQSTQQLRHQAGKTKTKDCWFHVHHPSGCSLDDASCGYLHTHKP